MIKKLPLFLLLIPSLAWSAPAITTPPTGTFSDGGTINITGTGFGNTGPTVALFDNFEAGTTNARIGDGATSATIGSYIDCGGSCAPNYYSTYSTVQAHSGTKASRQDWSTDGQDGGRWMGVYFASRFTNVYISYWEFLPSGENVPGVSMSLPNWKHWWLSTDGVYGSDYGIQHGDNSSPSTLMVLGTIDGGEDRCGGSSGAGACQTTDYTPSPWRKGVWNRHEAYIQGDTGTGGVVQGWLMNSAAARTLWQNYTGGDNTLYAGDSSGWQHLHFPGYARSENTRTYYDDIYVATGAGARARVEIGNASTYAACTNLAIITPTSWSNTSIAATVRAGSFSSGTAYLYVTDSSGVTGPAEEITLGSTTSGSAGRTAIGGASIPSGGGSFR